MSLVITQGFGIDIDAQYTCPFIVTLTEADALEGVLISTDCLAGTLVASDSMDGTLIATDALEGCLDDDTLTGTVGCP